MAPEYNHVFSFQVLNGLVAQAAPSISIVVGGHPDIVLAPLAILTEISKANVTGGLTGVAAPIRGIQGGSAPLLLHKPRFEVRDVSQSNPVISTTNVLTVSLRSSVDLLPTDGIVITISNLVGAVAVSPIDVARVTGGNGAELLFCEASAVSSGRWVADAVNGARLQLSLCSSARLLAGTVYVFSVTVTNPPTEQPAPTVMISATGGLTFQTEATTWPGTRARGLPGASEPLTVVEPRFLVADAGQTNPAAGLENIISLTLTPNVDIYGVHMSAITFTGLPSNQHYAAQQASQVTLLGGAAGDVNDGRNRIRGILSPLPPPATTINAGSWDTRDGVLTFFVARDKQLSAQVEYVISFQVTNRDTAVDTPDILVEASSDAPFLPSIMHQPYVSAGGVPNGANAFYVTRPEFVTRTIWQATPVVGTNNTITMTLSPNFNLYGQDSSVIFITGLLGSGLGARVKLATSLALFCFNGDASQANYAAFDANTSTLSMRLCPSAQFLVGQVEKVSLNLTNPTLMQASPSIIVSASGTYVFLDSAMIKSGAIWQGLANLGGHQPLMTVAILEWTGANVTSSPAKGGAKIELRGQPFPSSFGVATLPYNCSFDLNGVVSFTETEIQNDDSVIVCASPLSVLQEVMNFGLQYNGQQLDLGVPTALTHDNRLFRMGSVAPNPFLVSDGWDLIAPVSPSEGASDGGTVISIIGYGFNWRKGYMCSFFTSTGSEETDAVVRSTTLLTCRTPVWGLKHAAAPAAINIVRINGPAQRSVILFTNDTVDESNSSFCELSPEYGRCAFAFNPVWTMTGKTATFDLPPSQPSVFSAAGGDKLRVSGMGFDANVDYVCRFVFRYGPFEHSFHSPHPAQVLNHTTILCSTPAWKYYYTQEAVMELYVAGESTPVALTTGEHFMAFTFQEVYYSIEPSSGPAAGGYRVTVRGLGFDQGKRYRIRLDGSDVGQTRVESFSQMSFIMPKHLGSESTVNLTVQYDDLNPIRQGELLRLLPDSLPSHDNLTWTGANGNCATYAYPQANWNRCFQHQACDACGATCATECGWLSGQEAQSLPFALDPQWVEVDMTLLDPSFTPVLHVEAYGVGAPHKYFCAYPHSPLLACNLSENEAYLSCPSPLAAYDSGQQEVELRVYQGSDAASAVSIKGPLDPNITLVHVNRPPVFRIRVPWIDTVFENNGAYDEVLATDISTGNRGSGPHIRESQQLLTFAVTYAPHELFDVPPKVAVDGRLRFRIKDRRNGVARLWVTLHDDGGTLNGGVDSSAVQVVYLVVRSKVEAPALMLLPNPLRLFEGMGGRIIHGFVNVSMHLEMHPLKSLIIDVQPVTPADLEYFREVPKVLHNGKLVFELKEYAFGTANLLVLFTGIDGSSGESVVVMKNVSMEIAAVNQAPSFSLLHTTVAVNETRGWEQGVLELEGLVQNILPRQDVPQDRSPRGEDWAERSQNISFLVVVLSEDSGVVRADEAQLAPRVDIHGSYPTLQGTVKLVTRENFNGLLVLNLSAIDSGNASSQVQQLHVQVLPVNDAPRLDANCNVSQRTYCVPSCERYPYDVPSVGVIRSLLSSGAAGKSSECVNASSQVRIQVDENCENCPDDGQMFDGFDLSVTQCSGRRFSVAGLFPSSPSIWDSPDEMSQNLTFIVTQIETHVEPDTGYVSLFSMAPEVRQADGRLTFCLLQDANGNATFELVVIDDGGEERGGIVMSHVTVLVIDVLPVNQAPLFGVAGPLLTMWAGTGNQTLASFASNISMGNKNNDLSDREESQHATFHITLDERASDIFKSGVSVDEQGTLRVELQPYQVGTTHAVATLIDDGGVYGAGRNSSLQAFLMASVDSVLLLKVSIKITDIYASVDSMQRDAAGVVSSLLSLEEEWIQMGLVEGDLRVYDLVCGACDTSQALDACSGRNVSRVISAPSPWVPLDDVSFYARVLLADLNYTWAERVESGVVPALWKVSWVQHMLHSNCANVPSFQVGGVLARPDAAMNKSLADYNKTVVFNETTPLTSNLSLAGFLSVVVAPQDVAIDSDGAEIVIFDLEPIAHKLFSRAQWTFDGTDGGLMQDAPQVVPTYNFIHPGRFRASGECHEAELVIFPKPFWNGRILYRVAMRGSSAVATFELEVVPVNQIPTFEIEDVVYVNEDAGSISIPGVASFVTAGPAVEDEQQQMILFHLHLIEGRGDILESISLNISNGSAALQLQTVLNGNGILIFNISLRDYDMVGYNNLSSAFARMRLLVVPVNDAPVLALNCSSNETSLYSMTSAGLENEVLRTCSGGVEASSSCRTFGSSSCAMLIHVDENCDNCVGKEAMTAEDGGSTCFVSHGLMPSRPSLDYGLDEANQTVSFVFELVSGVDMLLAPFGVVTHQDTLTFCLREDVNGVATYQVIVVDDGGQQGAGLNVSEITILELDVHAVNQAPSFLVCCESMVTLWTGGVQTLEDFAHSILKGRANPDGSDREWFQNASFTVVAGMGTDRLFATLPAVSATGSLTASFLPAVTGLFHFSVYLVDDAGTYGQGQNTSHVHNVSLAVVDSYVAFRISLNSRGMLVEQSELERYARETILQILEVPHPHWVTMCGNHSLLNDTICQEEAALAAFARTGTQADWRSALNSLKLRTIYVLARSGEEAVAYSLMTQEIGQALRNKVSRTLKVEALPIRRNLQQQPHFDIDPASLEHIFEVDLAKWSEHGSNATTVRTGFLKNVSAPHHVPYNLEAQEHLLFELRPLGHRLFGRENWTHDGTDGGLMVWPPNVTSDCQPLCDEATLTLAPREFWNGQVMYELKMLTTDVTAQLTIFVQPVNQPPRFEVLDLVYMLGDGISFVNPAAFAIIAGPPVEDEKAQLMQAFVEDSDTGESLGSAHVGSNRVAINVSLPGVKFTGNTSVQVVVTDSGTYLGAISGVIDSAASLPRTLHVQSVRVNVSMSVSQNDECSTSAGCVHLNYASDISGLSANGQPLTYMISKLSGESVDEISISPQGTLTVHSVFDKIGASYFRVTLLANGTLPVSFVDRVTAINVSYVNQPPRFTLVVNGSAVLVVEQLPVPLPDDAHFDAGYGGCHSYSSAYVPTEELPANVGFCLLDDACLACAAACAEECGTLGGLPTSILVAHTVLSGAPLIAMEEVQTVTFSMVRLSASQEVLNRCNFGFPSDIHAQDHMEADRPLLQGEPYMFANGTLLFHLTPNRFGVVPFNVTLTEQSNMSTTKLMCFTVMPVNQRPTFSLRHDIVHVAESFDGGVVTCAACVALAYDMNAGPLELYQTLTFVVSPLEARIPSLPDVTWEPVNNAQVFGIGGQTELQLFETGSLVSIDARNGTLSFRLRAKRYGKVRFQVNLRDSGGLQDGGIDESIVHVLVLDVMPVNDAPTFALVVPRIYVSENPEEQTMTNLHIGSNLTTGPWAESSQTVSYRIHHVAGPEGVVIQPLASSSTGERVLLDFKVAHDRFGNVTLAVTVVDDGKRDLEGQDSSTYLLQIFVSPVNNVPTLLLVSNQMLVNRNSGCSGLSIYGGKRSRVVGTKVKCSASWDDPGSARLQDLGAGKCDRAGETLVHEHLGFLAQFSLGAFEDGPNGCPTSADHDVCCRDSCVNTSAPHFSDFPACGCEKQLGVFNMTALDLTAESSLFDEPPRFLFPCGVLYFKLKRDASGRVDYSLALSDGIASSPSTVFTIAVLKSNIAPYFSWSMTPLIQVMEDSGPYNQTVANNVSVDGRNGALEPEQSVSFMFEPGFSSLFDSSAQLRIEMFPSGATAQGRLLFTPAADAFGTQTFTVALVDDGGIERGGNNTLKRQLTIVVVSVNDAPYFTVPPFLEILESSGLQFIPGFAFTVSPGADSEVAVQSITFSIDYLSAPELFSRTPAITPEGTLILMPEPSTSGYAVLTVRLIDNDKHGGPEGHNCASIPHTFTINIKALNSVPGFALPWQVTCETTTFLQEGVCTCPVVASVQQPTAPPVACFLHNTTSVGLPYLCPTLFNPQKECSWVGREAVSDDFVESTVSVLEDSGHHLVNGLVHAVSSENGRSAGAMTRFYQTAWDPQLEMMQVYRDDVLGQPGLEYVHAYAHSADGKYVYAVERELNSLAIFEKSAEILLRDTDGVASGTRLDILDRLSEGQDRIHFLPSVSSSFSSEAVCGLTQIWIQERPYVIAASGCQLLHDYSGNLSNSSCISQLCDSKCCDALQQGVIGHWEMSLDHMYGHHRLNALSPVANQQMDFTNSRYWRYIRSRRTTDALGAPCPETLDTELGPSTIRDLSDTLGAAIFRGAGLFCKKITLADWDKLNNDVLSAANFIMNNGELEAMQFDGSLNLGLLVAEDANSPSVNAVMPSGNLSVEVWFTLSKATAVPSQNRGLIAAFMPGPLPTGTGTGVLESECRAGWQLSYKATASGVDTLNTIFTFELVAHNKSEHWGNESRGEEIAILKTVSTSLALKSGEWHHVLAVSNMHSLTIYLDGHALSAAESVTCPNCQSVVYQRESAQCALLKTPLTIGTICSSGNCDAVPAQWSQHIGALFSARVFNRSVTQAEVPRFYSVYNARLTPINPLYYWAAGDRQLLWATGQVGQSSPSNSTMPMAPFGAAAMITIRGMFLRGETYTLRLRDEANFTMSLSSTAELATQLVFDFTNRVWKHAYAVTVMSILNPDNLPIWQRVCLNSECGLSSGGTLRNNGLSPGLRGSRVSFNFITDSRALSVSISNTGAPSFSRQDTLLPVGAFLGAASSKLMHVDGKDYLAVANFWDGRQHSVPSRLLRLVLPDPNASTPRFETVQNISTRGARQWAKVDVSQVPGLSSSTMLVLANYLAPSLLMPWRGATVPSSPVDIANSIALGTSLGVSAVKVFNVSGWPYIVLSVFADPNTANTSLNVNVPSRIVRLGSKLNNTHTKFGPWVRTHDANMSSLPGLGVAVLQELDVSGAHDVEVFRAHGKLYLMFAVNLVDQDSLLYMSAGGDSEPNFNLLQRVRVGGLATSLHAFYAEVPPDSFGSTVASAFAAADPVHIAVGRGSGQAVVLRFNGTHLLSLPDDLTLPLDWAGGYATGSNTPTTMTQSVLAVTGAAGALKSTMLVLGQYEVAPEASMAPYSPSQVLERKRLGVRGLEAPSSVLEIEAHGKIYVVVASLHMDRLSLFERTNSINTRQFLSYHGQSDRCANIIQFPRRLDDYPKAQMLVSGWSVLAGGFPNMSSPCVFAASAGRGAVAAFCFNASSHLQCVDVIFDGQEVDGDRIVDGLAGAVALSVSNDGCSLYVAGLHDQAVALLQWSQDNVFVYVDRLKQGERLIHTLHMEIDDTVPNEPDTPPGFFRVQLPLELPQYLTVDITAGFPEAGSSVTFKLPPTAQPGGIAYAPLPPPAPLKYPARLGGNMRNWSLNARDTEHWTSDDGSRYMAIASSDVRLDPDGNAVVAILAWDDEVKRFDVIQHLVMHDMAPSALVSFEVTDVVGQVWRYLAVGSSLRHGDLRASINIYRWDPRVKHFVWHHPVPATLAGGHPNDPLTGLSLPQTLSIEKLVHWELDGQHYVAAAVSQVVWKVGYLDEQRTVSCEQRPGDDSCIINISLACQVRINGSVLNVTHYDWLDKQILHDISNCTQVESAQVCNTGSRTEDGKISTGFRPHIVSTFPFDVASCITGQDTRCKTNISGPSSPFGNCTQVNHTRCTDEHPYTVCKPHYMWITGIQTSERAYVYKWNDYGSTVLEDGQVGHGSGLQIFQLLDAPRSFDVDFRLLEQQTDGGALRHALLMLASFGHSGPDGNIEVYSFNAGIYNPFMRGNVGLFLRKMRLPCRHPTALALHTVSDARLGLVGTVMAVATSNAPLAATAEEANMLPPYNSTLLLYTWDERAGSFQEYIVPVVGDSMVPRGAMGLKFFEESGELYLAVAQGVCFIGQHNETFDVNLCERSVAVGEVPAQPHSRLLQLNRVKPHLGEVLALTDASNMLHRGLNVPDGEILEHQQPVRVPSGRTREWEVIYLDNRTLLVAASETRGALIFEFAFDHVVGLAGVSSIASNGTTWLNGRPFERVFVAAGDDRALLTLMHDKWANSNTFAAVNGSLVFRWDAVLSMSPLTVRRDVVTRGAGEVLGLEAPRNLRVMCETREAKVAHREFRDQEICYIDVTTGADRAELPCSSFAPIPAPTRLVLQQLSNLAESASAPNPICQTLTFELEQVSSSNAMLFEPDGMPAIAPNGSLSFRLRDLQYGVSRQRVVLADSEGMRSISKFVVIQVLTVNHSPFFTLTNIFGGQDNVLGEQQVVFAPSVSPGAPHEAHQQLTWTFTYNNVNMFEVAPQLTTRRLGSGDLVGIISFTTKETTPFVSTFQVVLVDDGPISTRDGSNNTSPMGSFTLTVLANNNPPKVIKITGMPSGSAYPAPEVVYKEDDEAMPPIVHTLEDQGPVSLSVAFNNGHSRESTQLVTFQLVSVEAVHSPFTGKGLLSSFVPVVPSSGRVVSPAQMTFQTAKGYNGRFLVTVAIMDNGGTENFGNNRTDFSFTLLVQPRDSFPAYVLLKSVNELEMHEELEVVREAVLGNFTAMPDDEMLRLLSFVILSNDAPWLFSEGPAFTLDGAARFTLAPARAGSANVVVALKNDLKTLDDRSVLVLFSVAQVNSPPTAKVPKSLAVLEREELARQILDGALFDVLPGPFFDEWDSQRVSFRVSYTTSTASLFASPPSVDSNSAITFRHTSEDLPRMPPHTLHFNTTPGVHGVADLTLVPYDNGGVLRGGIDVGQALHTKLKIYPLPRVHSVHPRMGAVWGGVDVTVLGDFFGSEYSRGYVLGVGGKYGNVSVLFGASPCEQVEVISDSELRCTAPPGRGCANVSLTILDGSLTRTGFLACGYVYTEIVFGGVEQNGAGVLALGPKDGAALAPSALLDLKLSKSVLALKVVGGGSQLVLGGSFLSAGGVRVNHVALYDSHEVHKLGNGVDGAVHALVQLPGGDIVAAGVFTKSFLANGGAVATGGLARWDGVSWSTIDCLATGSFFAAAVNGSMLYVAGRVKETCGIPTRGIALWDSYRWRALGAGLSGGAVHAIALHHDFVYVGGSFVEAGGIAASRVARWDGADWHALGELNGDVHALAVFGEYVFAGGDFTLAGSKPCRHLARFYSGDWVQVGDVAGGLDGPVLSLQPLNSCLYFGGSFSQVLNTSTSSNDADAGGSKAKNMARLARWCEDEGVFKAVDGAGVLLNSVRAIDVAPLHAQCSATAAVC